MWVPLSKQSVDEIVERYKELLIEGLRLDKEITEAEMTKVLLIEKHAETNKELAEKMVAAGDEIFDELGLELCPHCDGDGCEKCDWMGAVRKAVATN